MIDNGGYVYPRKLPNVPISSDKVLEFIHKYSGKTLLDDFAGQAMQSLTKCTIEDEPKYYPLNEIASDAYDIAEAMVKEKRKREE